jgi:hypothetical protein
MTTRLSQEQRLRLAKETEWRQNYAHYGVHPGISVQRMGPSRF